MTAWIRMGVEERMCILMLKYRRVAGSRLRHWSAWQRRSPSLGRSGHFKFAAAHNCHPPYTTHAQAQHNNIFNFITHKSTASRSQYTITHQHIPTSRSHPPQRASSASASAHQPALSQQEPTPLPALKRPPPPAVPRAALRLISTTAPYNIDNERRSELNRIDPYSEFDHRARRP